MRTKVWSTMTVAALALAGCSKGSPDASTDAGNPAAASSAAAPAAGNKITGSVSLRDSSYKLSPAAKLEIDLVDNSTQGAAPVASKNFDPVTSVPQAFELDFDPSQIKPTDTYLVKASLTDGDRSFTMPVQVQVLTKGFANQANIQLDAAQTPGEKLLADFRQTQSQPGAMKMSQGSKLDGDVSRGWQVFRKAGQVVFIRENADAGDKGGFTTTDYAYQDGKPMVVEQKKRGSSTVSRAGWDADGKLVLKQSDTNGNVQPLDDGEAASLQKQAQYIYGLAGKGH